MTALVNETKQWTRDPSVDMVGQSHLTVVAVTRHVVLTVEISKVLTAEISNKYTRSHTSKYDTIHVSNYWNTLLCWHRRLVKYILCQPGERDCTSNCLKFFFNFFLTVQQKAECVSLVSDRCRGPRFQQSWQGPLLPVIEQSVCSMTTQVKRYTFDRSLFFGKLNKGGMLLGAVFWKSKKHLR